MSQLCSCPASTALTTIPSFTCGDNFGQIQKIAFQRLTSNGTKNGFTASAKIGLLASWQTLIAASDATKIVVTPFVENPTQEGGDAITFGGGNETLGGVEQIIGRNASSMTFTLRQFPQSTIKILKELQCEGNLGVYLFSESGAIEAINGGTDIYYPIPVRSVFVSDKMHGGFDNLDYNTLQFSFIPNYSDDLEIVEPSFNPLTDL